MTRIHTTFQRQTPKHKRKSLVSQPRQGIIVFGLISVILFSFAQSCSSTKKAAEENPAPAWVKQRPLAPDHYIGIGTVRKIGLTTDFTDEARERALNDMASSISSMVSSSSVLFKIENQYGGTEGYTQNITVETNEYLEGFEPYDAYETEDRYWVYYRISKAHYQKVKKERKDKAVNTALTKQHEAAKQEQQQNVLGALKTYIQALTAMKQYLGESNMTSINGEQIELGSYLLSKIENLRAAIHIDADHSEIKAKRHQISNYPIRLVVTYNDRILGGAPLFVKYSGSYLTNNKYISDRSGEVKIRIESSSSATQDNTLTARFFWENIVENATTDLAMRRLLSPISMPKETVKVITTNPTVAYKLEKSVSNYEKAGELEGKFTTLAHQHYLDAVGDEKNADFVVETSYSLTNGESSGGLTAVYCEGIHKLASADGKIIKQITTQKVRGVGSRFPLAKTKALDEFFSEG
ncbi:MAG: LPP20 family lipoprotein, partial [Salinivirgaceae bacterium]|nr:LPP20 family lipoprotein [Salinivirgaceae bacterium]